MNKARLSSLRSVGKNWGKMAAMTLIVALGFAFIFGISISPSKVRDTFDLSLRRNCVSDFQVKSKSASGFNDEELSSFQAIEGADTEICFCLDSSSFSSSMSLFDLLDDYGVTALKQNEATKDRAEQIIKLVESLLGDDVEKFVTFTPDLMSSGNDRIMCFPNGKSEDVNVLNIVEGDAPVGESEILADSLYCKGEVGDEVSIFGKSYKIAGKASNPLYFARTYEPDVINEEPLDNIYYLNFALSEAPSLDALIQSTLSTYLEGLVSLPDALKNYLESALASIKVSFPSVTDCFIKYDARDSYNLFSYKYEDFLKEKKAGIAGISKNIAILGPDENYSHRMLKESCEKMDKICYVIPVFFLAVAGLVVSITMSRMIEEERSQIACLASLGYKNSRISSKYLLLASAATLSGIGLGMLGGYFAVYPLIYTAFQYPYLLPAQTAATLNPVLTLISAAAMLAFILLITLGQLRDTLHPLPAILLLPKSPGSGVQTALERSSLWKKFPFRFKSTFRNLVRYKKRLFMTAISVGGSTAIVFLGFALLNIVSKLKEGQGGAVASSIIPISYFLIGFAIVLAALVLYSLTDMSIAERSREIATLEVLGYHDKETVFYLYREIAVMTVAGLIIGIPLGVVIMQIVIVYLNFGSLGDIEWYSYLIPVLIIGAFSALVDALLLPKIKRIDMISSLKSVD